MDYSQLKLADKKQVALPQNAPAKSPVPALLVVQLFEATRTWLKDSQWKHSNFPLGQPRNCPAFQRNTSKQTKDPSSRNATFLDVYPILSTLVCYQERQVPLQTHNRPQRAAAMHSFRLSVAWHCIYCMLEHS